MLVYKAQQVVSATRNDPKAWEMNGQKGVSHTAKLAVISTGGDVAVITLKSKTADDLNAKVAKYGLGKAAEVPILSVNPVFRQGERKPSAYEYFG